MTERKHTFENLIVWQKAHQFTLKVYKMTKTFPKEEMYGLTSQIRRASTSITANIVEGFGRKSIKEKLRFYNISQASLYEVKYFLILIHDLEYHPTFDLRKDLDEVEKLLYSYMKAISDSIK